MWRLNIYCIYGCTIDIADNILIWGDSLFDWSAGFVHYVSRLIRLQNATDNDDDDRYYSHEMRNQSKNALWNCWSVSILFIFDDRII